MVHTDQVVHFTLAGAAALNSRLIRKIELSTDASQSRTEWQLLCPLCQSFLGYWICAHNDAALSTNQQRKNRNTMLLGKSHYRKIHAATVNKATHSSSKSDNHSDTDSITEVQSPGGLVPELDMIQRARDGDADAQCLVAWHFENQQKYEDAFCWYKRAAEAGSFVAQFNLSRLYEGQGVTKDLSLAHAWMLKAAEQGFTLAQYHVGQNYEFGDGVTQSHSAAIEWYRKAAIDRSEEKKDPHFHRHTFHHESMLEATEVLKHLELQLLQR